MATDDEMLACCGNCPYWLPESRKLDFGDGDNEPIMGKCHASVPGTDGPDDWPTTGADGFCGEHPLISRWVNETYSQENES